MDVEYSKNDYLNQNADHKKFSKEYVGELLQNPFISYTDMKNFYPTQVIDLRFQVKLVNPRKVQIFEEYRANVNNVRLFTIIIQRTVNTGKLKLFQMEVKLLKLLLLEMTKLGLKDSRKNIFYQIIL